MEKPNVLFVCTVNRMRSATAHKIFENDPRFFVKSAGTDADANTVLTQELLDWANVIIVMDKSHRNRIQKKFPETFKSKPVICLYIPDEYDFMQPELIGLLKFKVDKLMNEGFFKKSF